MLRSTLLLAYTRGFVSPRELDAFVAAGRRVTVLDIKLYDGNLSRLLFQDI